MAQMWRELSMPDNFSFNPSENDEDWTGIRTFLRDDDNGTILPANLPVPGISNVNFRATAYYRGGFQPTSFIAREVNFILDCGDELSALNAATHYVVTYAAKSLSDRNFPNEQTPTESLTMGNTVMSIENRPKNGFAYKWANNAAGVGNVIRIDVPTADYSTSDPGHLSFASAIASVTRIGAVSNSDGRWLSVGANISEYRDDEDNALYLAIRNYKFKEITGPAFDAAITGNDRGWQCVWDPARGLFDHTILTTYSTVAFTDIMPGL